MLRSLLGVITIAIVLSLAQASTVRACGQEARREQATRRSSLARLRFLARLSAARSNRTRAARRIVNWNDRCLASCPDLPAVL